MNRVYLLVLPTKIERNMWLYSLKNMRKELYYDKEEEFRRVNVEYFTAESQKVGANFEGSFHITITNKKPLEGPVPKFYDLQRINLQISQLWNSYYTSHTRPPMDFGDLKNLHDDEARSDQKMVLQNQVNQERIFGLGDIYQNIEKENGKDLEMNLQLDLGPKKLEAISFDLKDELSFNFNGSLI